MCMNLETRIERVPVLVLQFDCMKMGADGVSLLKPDAEGGITSPEQGVEGATPDNEGNTLNVGDADKKKINMTRDSNVYEHEEPINSNENNKKTPLNISSNTTTNENKIDNVTTKKIEQ